MRLLLVLLGLLFSLAPAASAREADEVAPPTMADVQAALKRNDPAGAARIARAIAKAQPQNASAWFMLGYCLHAQGKLEEAVVVHEKAATFPKVAPVALFNLACAQARLGAKDQAFDALTRARAAGFLPNPQTRRDPDLVSLCDDPRFDKLIPPAGANLPRGNPKQFDFWLGAWDAKVRLLGAKGQWNPGGTLRIRIERAVGGHGVVEYTEGSIGGSTPTHGFSLRAFDPRENVWTLLLLWPSPGKPVFSMLQGGFRHGRGEFLAGRGASLTRFTFSDTGAGRFRWDQATSKDKRAWTTTMMFLGTRRADGKDIAVRTLTPSVCPGDEFRSFDFLCGKWDAFEGRSIMGGAAVVTESEDEYAIRAYDPGRKAWVCYVLRYGSPRFVRYQGTPDSLANATERLRWVERGKDRLVRVRERRVKGEWKTTKRDVFARRAR